MKWLEDNFSAIDKWDKTVLEDFEALVIDLSTKKAFVYTDRLYPIETKAPFAIGSGFKYAMGAMLAGADAFKAVEISRLMDRNSGGQIHHIDLETCKNDNDVRSEEKNPVSI